jgi:hypothetical protein
MFILESSKKDEIMQFYIAGSNQEKCKALAKKLEQAGVAIGQGKPVFNIGRRENMLMWHPLVTQFYSVEALIEFLDSH